MKASITTFLLLLGFADCFTKPRDYRGVFVYKKSGVQIHNELERRLPFERAFVTALGNPC
jgi:hypothetical protein